MTENKKLRDCLGLFTTGVCIATVKIDEKKYTGITINSFSSLSLKPPLLLFAIDNNSSNLEYFLKAEDFAINILAANQEYLSRAFASKHYPNRWDIDEYFVTKLGNRVFNNSMGFFECKKHLTMEVGDHHIIIGDIVYFEELNKSPPLLYSKGNYSLLKNSNKN